MAEKSMKNGSKIRWMGATYISLYQKMGDAYIKPISAYITGWGNAYIKPIYAYMKKWRKPISSLYRLILLGADSIRTRYRFRVSTHRGVKSRS